MQRSSIGDMRMNDVIDVLVQPATGCAVVLLVGVLSMQTLSTVRAALADLLARAGCVVADLSRLDLRHPGCAAVFSTAWAEAGGWPRARLAVVGPNPRMLAHLASQNAGPEIPVADSVESALALTEQPPRPGPARIGPGRAHRMSLMGSIAEQDPDTARYVEDWLGILVEHDAATQSELVGTLFAFLGNDGDDDATARALGVDPSTVRQRIHRIRELTGFNLQDPDIVDDLHAATRIVTRHSLLHQPAAAVPEQRPASHDWPSQTY
jgi:hypothetical protein